MGVYRYLWLLMTVCTACKSSCLDTSLVLLVRWCGPCQILGPRLEKAIAKQKGRVAMAKVDIDDHTDLAIEYGVSYIFFCYCFARFLLTNTYILQYFKGAACDV